MRISHGKSLAAILLVLFPLQVSWGETRLIHIQEAPPHSLELSLSEIDQGSAYLLTVKSQDSTPSPEISLLASPPRVVIDLPGLDLPDNRHVKIPENATISELRFGRHPGRGRIVLALSRGDLPTPAVHATGNQIDVSLNWENQAERAQLRYKEALEGDHPSNTALPMVRSPRTSDKVQVAGQPSRLRSVNFDRTDNETVLRAVFDIVRSVELKHIDDHSFTLSVYHCSVEDRSLLMPLSAATSVPAFRYAQAKEIDDTCLIRIGVDADIDLKTVQTPTEVTVHALPRLQTKD